MCVYCSNVFAMNTAQKRIQESIKVKGKGQRVKGKGKWQRVWLHKDSYNNPRTPNCFWKTARLTLNSLSFCVSVALSHARSSRAIDINCA